MFWLSFAHISATCCTGYLVLVPNPANMLNSTRYCSRKSYCQYDGIRAWMS